MRGTLFLDNMRDMPTAGSAEPGETVGGTGSPLHVLGRCVAERATDICEPTNDTSTGPPGNRAELLPLLGRQLLLVVCNIAAQEPYDESEEDVEDHFGPKQQGGSVFFRTTCRRRTRRCCTDVAGQSSPPTSPSSPCLHLAAQTFPLSRASRYYRVATVIL